NLGPGAGHVFLVTQKPVGKLKIAAPADVHRGKNILVKVLLCDSNGEPLQAVVPLQVTIRDAQGRVADKSGFYGAPDGSLNIELNIAPNDVKGNWQIEVQENVTG